MGNCANKPSTADGEALAPEEKPNVEDREIEVDPNKVTTAADDDHNKATPSLGQMLEAEEKKPEGEVAGKPAEEKPLEPTKLVEVAKEVVVETKKEEAPKPAVEPPKPEVSEPKKDEPKPAEVPATTEKKVDDKTTIVK